MNIFKWWSEPECSHPKLALSGTSIHRDTMEGEPYEVERWVCRDCWEVFYERTDR